MKANDIIDLPSIYSVPETTGRLESLLRTKGMTIFARIDPSAEGKQ